MPCCICRLHTGASAAALVILRDSAVKRLPQELTSWWAGLLDERKWRKDAGETLVRNRLFHAPDLDAHLTKVVLGQITGYSFVCTLVYDCTHINEPCRPQIWPPHIKHTVLSSWSVLC